MVDEVGGGLEADAAHLAAARDAEGDGNLGIELGLAAGVVDAADDAALAGTEDRVELLLRQLVIGDGASTTINGSPVRMRPCVDLAHATLLTCDPVYPERYQNGPAFDRLARKARIDFSDCRDQAFIQISQVSPIHNVVQPEFSQFWNDLEPAISCNSTTMAKRLIVAGRGISFFSRIGFMDEIARGDVDLVRLREREARCAASADLQEGLAAMAERREPRFAGR